jgi:hypothetical protein
MFIKGSSTESAFVATHFDLCIVSATNHKTFVDANFKTCQWSDYSLVKRVGQLPVSRLQGYAMTHHLGKDLEMEIHANVYKPLFRLNRNEQWSSVLNCQTFTRQAIEYFGWRFPNDVELISDISPTMVDIHLGCSFISNNVTETFSF